MSLMLFMTCCISCVDDVVPMVLFENSQKGGSKEKQTPAAYGLLLPLALDSEIKNGPLVRIRKFFFVRQN